jgi:hypothetical protein
MFTKTDPRCPGSKTKLAFTKTNSVELGFVASTWGIALTVLRAQARVAAEREARSWAAEKAQILAAYRR